MKKKMRELKLYFNKSNDLKNSQILLGKEMTMLKCHLIKQQNELKDNLNKQSLS